MYNAPKPKPYERLRSVMELIGYNQEAMARVMGLSASTFNLKINGKREFTLFECNLIANKLGRTLDDIFFISHVPKQEQNESKKGA